MKKAFLSIFLLLVVNNTIGQPDMRFRVHSHNDYLQNVPFWEAYSAGASSVEADIFLEEAALYVAHTKAEIDTLLSLEELYLKPIQKRIDIGMAFEKPFQLLIDIKSEPYTTLNTVIEVLRKYPLITSNKNISLVISGNRPKPNEYIDYPEYILFDYQSLETIADVSILNKIALVSFNFKNFSEWNGKGRLTANDLEKVKATIEKAHAFGKPFRFWGTPDSKKAWKAFAQLGVDFINTDRPSECAHYLDMFSKGYYSNTFSPNTH